MSAEIRDSWWDSLRHFGLLLAPKEVGALQSDYPPEPLSPWYTNQLRREVMRFEAGDLKKKDWIAWVLQNICGFGKNETGEFLRGRNIPTSFVHSLITRENLKPTHLWTGENSAVLPVFAADVKRIGIGRGRKSVSDVVQWLRAAGMPLGVVTNGREWRLVYAGLDFDAGCEWSLGQWFTEGQPGPQLDALRLLLQPKSFVPAETTDPPLLASILASRRGQAELSSILGERVREAVELLVQSHRDAITEADLNANGADIYRAAVRVVMRLVVILFAESRDMLPRGDPVYNNAYGLGSLFEELQRLAARGHARLNHRFSSWPRLLGLFRLIYEGSHHPDLQVPQYGGELFAPGVEDDGHALSRALHVFETACFDSQFHLMPDAVVHRMLELLTRTEMRIRQGRAWTRASMPVDFSDLSSEYIGILYEGLLDYELRTADTDNPVVFLAVGDEPALPLARLEAMQDKDIKALFESLKDSGSSGDDEVPAVAADQGSAQQLTDEAAPEVSEESLETQATDDPSVDDSQQESEAARARAISWTRHACLAAHLIRKPAASASPEAKQAWEQKVDARARQLVRRVVLPGDWYLVRWGGTRKSSGTFYTRPALAVPTVQRTLRPLAYEPPIGADGNPESDAAAECWKPKAPESILALRVCDPACGSGSFPVAAVRFLTNALYASLFEHGRLEGDWRKPLPMLLGLIPEDAEELLDYARLPSAPDADDFEDRTKAVLRRFVVEHCIYGVDFDPLAAELCRLALWIETMDPELPFSFLDHKIRCGNSLVGAWFDTFAHYPAMAWSREGGDKSHGNGVHFKKGELTKAIKAHKTGAIKPDLERFLMGADLVQEDFQQVALETHDTTLTTLSELHSLPVQSAAERGRRYRDEFLGSPTYRRLKSAMDLWCSLWFWPATEIDKAPLPTSFASPCEDTLKIAAAVARQNRFFHWELEFPDVFAASGSGFDAIIGNPPWETFQPESKQFFSDIDPLYRAYGKQEALRHQKDYFAAKEVETNWIEYNATFKALSNWAKFASTPFGDPLVSPEPAEKFSICRGNRNIELHARWRSARKQSDSYAVLPHPFTHQGTGKAYSYKLFLEHAHSLLRENGALGFIVPSGLYSDHGTGALRELFLDHCRWEWLFGFENREKVFDIDSRFKFNPIIIRKGGQTEAINTAFMRRRLEDWQGAEKFATPYDRTRITQFSPKSKAILEIQSQRDLEILEKIYANSVLLGDDGPDGWGITYRQGDFNMASDSKLFPPRPNWEEKGYRPDEYSRWLKGEWRPINELWAELGARPLPEGERVCAQPPYDTLPVPRADIPEGIILSREADVWIAENEIADVALPLYEGRMIGQFDFSEKGWVSGKGRSAVWREIDWSQKQIEPQYLIAQETYFCELENEYANLCGEEDYEEEAFLNWLSIRLTRISFMDITSATNARTMIGSITSGAPNGHSSPMLLTASNNGLLLCILNSFAWDYVVRVKVSGLHLVWAVLTECPLVRIDECPASFYSLAARLAYTGKHFAASHYSMPSEIRPSNWHVFEKTSDHERLRLLAATNAVTALLLGLNWQDYRHVLRDVDHPTEITMSREAQSKFDVKGFWRIDKDKHPELRVTVLSLVAFYELQGLIDRNNGSVTAAVEEFCSQNDGEGWFIPEAVRLSDFGMGHDERAEEFQPVAEQLDSRLSVQCSNSNNLSSWRECQLHARNFLGKSLFEAIVSSTSVDSENKSVFPEHRDNSLSSIQKELF